MVKPTIEQIEAARVAILDNARELIEEAALLLKAGHNARAYALARLSTEELAKLPILVRAGSQLDAGIPVNCRIRWGISKALLKRRATSLDHSSEGQPN